LFGLYTGQRLRDIAKLTWHNIDTEGQELRFVTLKTGRRMSVPLASPLIEYLRTMLARIFHAFCGLFPALVGGQAVSLRERASYAG